VFHQLLAMMKSIMLPILLVSLANFTLPGSVVAEPAYCAGRGPGPNSDAKEVSPFFFLGTAVAGITGSRAICGMNTSADRAFWRSCHRHKGCSDDNQVGRRMAMLVEQTIVRHQRNAAEFRRSKPDRYNKICEKVKACMMPDSFPPPDDKLNCISAGALK